MSDLELELTAACDRLRIMIRNEQQIKDYAEAWRKMATTSSTQRRLKNEANGIKINVSFDKR